MNGEAEKKTITVDIAQAVAQLQANPELATMMMELVAPTAAKDIDLIQNLASELFTALNDIVEFCDDPHGSESTETLAEGLARLLPAARSAVAEFKALAA